MTKARSNAVANAAKGDLTVGNGTDLSGILAVGSNGDTLVADSSTSTGLRYQASQAAGRNTVINGGLDVWQRGTSFTGVTNGSYTADRWKMTAFATGLNTTVTQDTSVPNSASKYSIKVLQAASATSVTEYAARQLFETSQILQLCGNTVTLSFWYRSNLTGSHAVRLYASPMTGGTDVSTAFTVSAADTWEKKVINFSSFAGVTTASTAPTAEAAGLDIGFNVFNSASRTTLAASDYFQIAQVQLETGSVNTSFTRAGGTIQGELAACQRYYWRQTPTNNNGIYGIGVVGDAAYAIITIPLPATMRAGGPTSIDIPTSVSNLQLTNYYTTSWTPSAIIILDSTSNVLTIRVQTTGMTVGQAVLLRNNGANGATYFLGAGVEL